MADRSERSPARKRPSPAAIQATLRDFQKLFEKDPLACSELVEQLLRNGRHWRRVLPAKPSAERPNSVTVTEQTLALLLANYLAREQLNEPKSRKAWCAYQATKGIRFGHAGGTHYWKNANTIDGYLKRASKLQKIDPCFAAMVKARIEDLIAIGGPREG
jgi:hypothetical protein